MSLYVKVDLISIYGEITAAVCKEIMLLDKEDLHI